MAEQYAGLTLGVDVQQVNNAVKSLRDFKAASEGATDGLESFVNEEQIARQRAKDLASELAKQRKEFQSVQAAIDPTAAKMERLKAAAAGLDKLWKKGIVPDETFFQLGEMLETQANKLAANRKALTAEGRAAIEESKQKAKAAAEAQKFIAALEAQAAAAGKTQSELMEMKAAQLGVTAQAAPFIERMRQQEQATEKLGISMGQYRQAMRMLPAQITDVATSLASGMPIWLVAIQQGGQIKDSFGGIIPTFRALLSLISPLKVGFGAVVGVLGYMAYSAYSARKELKEISKTIQDATGFTSDFSNKLAVSVQELASVSGKSSEELVKSFATTKDTAGSLIKKLVDLGVSYADAADMARQYQRDGDISKLNGKIAEHMQKVADLEKTWWDVAKARLKAMGGVLTGDVEGTEYAGKKDTRRKSNLENALEIMTEYGKKNKEIADLNSKALAEATAEIEKQYFNTNRVANAQRELNELIANQKKLEKSNNEEAKQQAAYLVKAKKQEIEDLKKLEEKKGKATSKGGGGGGVVEQLDKELYVLQAQLKTLKEHRTVNDVISSQRRSLWSIEKQIEILEEAQSKRQLTAGEKKLLAEQKRAIELARQKAEIGDQIVLQERSNKLYQNSLEFIRNTQSEIDILNLKQQGMTEDQIRREQELQKIKNDYLAKGGSVDDQAYQDMIKKRTEYYQTEDSLRANWLAGAKNAWAEYARDATDMYGNVQEIASSALNGLSDQMTEFLTTGKANFADFANSILKMIVQMISKMVIFNALSGLTGGSTWTMGSLMSGFSSGGYTGDGGKYDPAGIVHKGEFVFTKEATQRIGAKNLYRLMSGYANGGSVGGSGYSKGATIGAGLAYSFGDINVDINNGNDPKGLETGVRMLVTDMLKREMGQGGSIYNFVMERR